MKNKQISMKKRRNMYKKYKFENKKEKSDTELQCAQKLCNNDCNKKYNLRTKNSLQNLKEEIVQKKIIRKKITEEKKID